MTQDNNTMVPYGFSSGHPGRLVIFLGLLAFLGLASPARAQSLPIMMMLKGNLSASSDGKVVPVDTDTVIAMNGAATEGTGVLSGGSYTLIVGDKTSAFNGTQLTLRLKRSGTVYALKFSDGSDAIVSFSGSLLPMPQTVNLVATSLVVSSSDGSGTGPGTGPGTGTGPGSGSGTGTGTGTSGDINGDGVVDEADISLLKRAISGDWSANIAKTKMDVNGDGVVNTRDLIELIRTVRDQSRTALRAKAALRNQ